MSLPEFTRNSRNSLGSRRVLLTWAADQSCGYTEFYAVRAGRAAGIALSNRRDKLRTSNLEVKALNSFENAVFRAISGHNLISLIENQSVP
jgi:hypothetical protein